MTKARLHLARHHLVWLDPACWDDLLAAHDMASNHPLVAAWAGEGRPLVVRTPGCGDEPHLLALGIPLPQAHGKQRIRLRCSPHHIVRSDSPPRLARAAMVSPPRWRNCIASLILLDPHARCFGSLGWEYLTGLSYLSTTSDLDLLWQVTTVAHANWLAREICRIQDRAPMQIDGEFVSPGGAGIHWREWQSQEPMLIAKTIDGPALLAREQVFA